jgi:hypothetical protein
MSKGKFDQAPHNNEDSDKQQRLYEPSSQSQETSWSEVGTSEDTTSLDMMLESLANNPDDGLYQFGNDYVAAKPEKIAQTISATDHISKLDPNPISEPEPAYLSISKPAEPGEPTELIAPGKQQSELYNNYIIPKLEVNGKLYDYDAIEGNEVNNPNPNHGHHQRKNYTCPVDPDCNRTTGFVDQELLEMHITFDHPEYALQMRKYILG